MSRRDGKHPLVPRSPLFLNTLLSVDASKTRPSRDSTSNESDRGNGGTRTTPTRVNTPTKVLSKKESTQDSKKTKTSTKTASKSGKSKKCKEKPRTLLQSARVSEIEDQMPSGTSFCSAADSKMPSLQKQEQKPVSPADCQLINTQTTQKTGEMSKEPTDVAPLKDERTQGSREVQ
uniref:Ovule protein n=1 Tax=Steinernema glaseri TaxID=37863 RepID=A0A1I7YHY2_9BILA